MSVFRLRWCGWCRWEWVGCLDQDLEGWGGVISMLVVSLVSLCRWLVQVSIYCARRIHAHFMCNQYPIMLHLSCICLW